MPLLLLDFPMGAWLPPHPYGFPPCFAQAAPQAILRCAEGRGELGRGRVLAGLRRIRGPHRVAFLSTARGSSGLESPQPAPRGPLCTDGPARTRREGALQAAARAASAEAVQGRGRGPLKRAGPPGPATAP